MEDVKYDPIRMFVDKENKADDRFRLRGKAVMISSFDVSVEFMSYLSIKRGCKQGLREVLNGDFKVHFILDGLNMQEIVEKGTKKTKDDYQEKLDGLGKQKKAPLQSMTGFRNPFLFGITNSELRFLYRNRSNPNFRDNVIFYRDFKVTAPPWETDPDTWKQYQPRVVAI